MDERLFVGKYVPTRYEITVLQVFMVLNYLAIIPTSILAIAG